VSALSVAAGGLVCADLELTAPSLPPIDPGLGAQLLVRLHGEPLGTITVPSGTGNMPNAEALAAAAQSMLKVHVRRHLESDGLNLPMPDPEHRCTRRLRPTSTAASVIVGTTGARSTLRGALESVLASDFVGDLEILVVDNRPSHSRVRALIEELDDPRLRYLAEPRAGVSYARNTGIAKARTDLLLFTDDDVLVDPGWVRSTVAVFDESPLVDAVTGLVVPASLATAAERIFEQTSSFNKGYNRLVWSLRDAGDPIYQLGPKGNGGPLFPYPGANVGSGNSMAFRRVTIERISGFDGDLRTGQDLDVFCRLILGGAAIVYEPRILVRHFHRDSDEALALQTRRYGIGLSALLTKQFVTSPDSRRRLTRLIPSGTREYFRAQTTPKTVTATVTRSGQSKELATTTPVPPKLRALAILGFAYGPVHYLRSRSRNRRAARLHPPRRA